MVIPHVPVTVIQHVSVIFIEKAEPCGLQVIHLPVLNGTDDVSGRLVAAADHQLRDIILVQVDETESIAVPPAGLHVIDLVFDAVFKEIRVNAFPVHLQLWRFRDLRLFCRCGDLFLFYRAFRRAHFG